jgi:hypothetical protein
MILYLNQSTGRNNEPITNYSIIYLKPNMHEQFKLYE